MSSRSYLSLLLLALAGGCNRPDGEPAAANAGGGEGRTEGVDVSASPPAAEPPAALAFDPGLKLKWPVKPREGCIAPDGTKSYHATCTVKADGGLVIYTAHVIEYTDADLEEATIEELMHAYVFAFQKYELSRKEIEHEPGKLPGLDIVRRRNGLVDRKIVVAAGRRLYDVSVTARGDDLPGTAEVKEFFTSFAVSK